MFKTGGYICFVFRHINSINIVTIWTHIHRFDCCVFLCFTTSVFFIFVFIFVNIYIFQDPVTYTPVQLARYALIRTISYTQQLFENEFIDNIPSLPWFNSEPISVELVCNHFYHTIVMFSSVLIYYIYFLYSCISY